MPTRSMILVRAVVRASLTRYGSGTMWWRAVREHRAFKVGWIYALAAGGTCLVVDNTLPVNLTRLLSTIALVAAFPIALLVAWLTTRPGRRQLLLVTAFIAFGAFGVWLLNRNDSDAAASGPYFIAHRGVHQQMHPEHNSWRICLRRIHPPEHDLIENTLPSIRAAFDHGARLVEIDIRPTADDDFAVFHDDMLDCKTEQKGPVADRSMQELRQLDVGYGYVTEAGLHPMRGKGVGMMRSLNEVLDAFPGKEFVIDVKFGGEPEYWDRLERYLARRGALDRERLVVSGADRGVAQLRRRFPGLRVASRPMALSCVRDYVLLGWSGYVPSDCRKSITGSYHDTGWMMWGFPNTWVERMHAVGTVVLMRPRGVGEPEFAAAVPPDYRGGIQTDRIEVFPMWMRAAQGN